MAAGMTERVAGDEPRMPGGESRSEAHLPALDGLRGVAILLVMVFHQTILRGDNAPDRLFRLAARFGWTGVDLFFVLSGFLITGILYDSKGQPHYFRNFYARRTVRIFPLYYLVVFLSFVVFPQWLEESLGRPIWYWLYLSNYSVAVRGTLGGFLDISWSLAIEEQFYLLWPLVVHRCERRTLIGICLVLIGVAPVFRWVLLWSGVNPVVNYVVTPARMDTLAAGALVALLGAGRSGADRLRPGATSLVATAAALLCIIVWARSTSYRNPLIQVFGYSALACLFAQIVALVGGPTPQSRLARILDRAPLRMFGWYSYALYLFHAAVQHMAKAVLFPQGLPQLMGSQIPAQLSFYVVATLMALLPAFLSWHLYEKHFLRLKRFFPVRSAVRDGKERDASSVVAAG